MVDRAPACVSNADCAPLACESVAEYVDPFIWPYGLEEAAGVEAASYATVEEYCFAIGYALGMYDVVFAVGALAPYVVDAANVGEAKDGVAYAWEVAWPDAAPGAAVPIGASIVPPLRAPETLESV